MNRIIGNLIAAIFYLVAIIGVVVLILPCAIVGAFAGLAWIGATTGWNEMIKIKVVMQRKTPF